MYATIDSAVELDIEGQDSTIKSNKNSRPIK